MRIDESDEMIQKKIELLYVADKTLQANRQLRTKNLRTN